MATVTKMLLWTNYVPIFKISDAVVQKCSAKRKKMVWIFSRKFKWKYLCKGLFFNEAAACNGTQTHKHIVYRRTKVVGCRTTNLSKRDPDDRGVFLWNLPSDWFRFLHTRPASLPVENTKATPTLHTHKVLSEIQ